jgi:hypothetical protein
MEWKYPKIAEPATGYIFRTDEPEEMTNLVGMDEYFHQWFGQLFNVNLI